MEWYNVEFTARTSVFAQDVEDAKRQVFRGIVGDIDVLEIVETYEEDE